MQMRNWLVLHRNSTSLDYSVGLGRQYPTPYATLSDASNSSPRSVYRSRRAFWSQDNGPGPYEGGDERKHRDLVEEWRTGEVASVCKKGNWEDNYAILHRSMLDGSRPPKLLSVKCGGGCGGLADR